MLLGPTFDVNSISCSTNKAKDPRIICIPLLLGRDSRKAFSFIQPTNYGTMRNKLRRAPN